MLGSSQVFVEAEDGLRLGYTGDFGWPLEPVRVDELVVDATYGNPEYVRSYKEEHVVDEFIQLVSGLVRSGQRVCIKAFTGRLQFAMQTLQDRVKVPFIAGKKQSKIAEVYQHHGVIFQSVIERYCDQARKLIAAREPLLAFHHLAEKVPESDYDSVVYVSSYMVPREEPVVKTASNHYRVALTDHADFNQTMEYISLAAPKLVVVDNSRGGDAWTLAEEIRARHNIPTLVGG